MKTFKKLLPYIKPHKGKFASIIFFGVIMSLANAGIAKVVQYLFDDVFKNQDARMAIIVPCLIPALYLIHGSCRYVHLYLLKYVGELVSTKIQSDLQSKYMILNLSYYNSASTGSLISKILNDVNAVQWGINIFADVIREPISIIILLGYMIYLDWKLTLLILIIGPIIVFILNRLARSVRKYSYRQQESMELFTSTLKETVDGVRIIQSFNLTDDMRRRLNKVISHYLTIRKKIIKRQESAGPITEFLAAIVVGAVFYYKGQDIIGGETSIGEFMSYFTALGLVQQPIKKLQDGIMRIQPTLASADRIFSILDAQDIVPEVAEPISFPKNWNEIEFRNVSFSYGEAPVLKNVNVKIKRGEVLALVGESGSGKSTFVNLLERFYDPTEGDILIGGISIQKMKLTELRANIALVTQDVFLFNDTVEQNIRSGNFDKETYSVEHSAQMANAHDFISRTPLKYETLAGDRGGRLSGGEKQRISIARAIYKNAPILILDEATSALDSASEVEVQKGLDKLMEGRTALVVAHRLSTIMNANRILVFRSGEIVEEGTHTSLIEKNGLYAQFLSLQKV